MSLVKRRREQAGLTQSELAKRTNMTASKVSKIENGHLKLKEEDILTFARALGCKTSELVRELMPVEDDTPTAEEVLDHV